jgi:hypothetical protein
MTGMSSTSMQSDARPLDESRNGLIVRHTALELLLLLLRAQWRPARREDPGSARYEARVALRRSFAAF